MFPYFLLLFLPSTLCSIRCAFCPVFWDGGSIDFGLLSFPVYVFKASSYHLNTVSWVSQVWISQISIIFYVKVFSNIHCVFMNYYSWNSTRSMSFIFPMFQEVFLVTLFWSLLIPWGAPSWSSGATVINTVDQLINNRRLFLIVLEAWKSQDHQQVPRLVRLVSWFLDCLLLLPVLAAWEPIPSWPDPFQSPCLLISSPRVGWSLRAHKPSAHCNL